MLINYYRELVIKARSALIPFPLSSIDDLLIMSICGIINHHPIINKRPSLFIDRDILFLSYLHKRTKTTLPLVGLADTKTFMS